VTTAWIDKTHYLVRQVVAEKIVGDFRTTATTSYDLTLNQPIPDKLLEFDPSVDPGEQAIVEALRGYTRSSGGKFPTSLTDRAAWTVIFPQGTSDDKLDEAAQGVLRHFLAMQKQLAAWRAGDFAYRGTDKSVTDADQIVFWYRRPDGTYRAVLADLTVKDVQREMLPAR
jgi:hypothetical protein